jgi:hypothetical protein
VAHFQQVAWAQPWASALGSRLAPGWQPALDSPLVVRQALPLEQVLLRERPAVETHQVLTAYQAVQALRLWRQLLSRPGVGVTFFLATQIAQ